MRQKPPFRFKLFPQSKTTTFGTEPRDVLSPSKPKSGCCDSVVLFVRLKKQVCWFETTNSSSADSSSWSQRRLLLEVGYAQ